jgi:hypothetical protein
MYVAARRIRWIRRVARLTTDPSFDSQRIDPTVKASFAAV